MLTMKAQYSLGNAESYFREHLGVGDYYMKGQTVSGQWFGEGARELGLSGVTTEKEFLNLCNNLHPQTEEQLTPRMNSKRVRVDKDGNVHESANRRVFYDFTLSPPKSVSIVALVGNDQRIIEAHDEAVQVAMRELQIYAATRVRKQNQYAHRVTGNVVGAVFRHDTSRDLDPQLHSHCILFNATRDSVEDRWKALEACEMVTAQKFVRNVYYHELVRSLQKFGYGVENNPRGDFEIIGVGKELIDRFSKRHRAIDEKTRELLEREPDKANQNIKVIRANIAHKERSRKIKNVGIVKLQSIWNKQLSWKERWQISRLDKHRSPETSVKVTAEQAINWAVLSSRDFVTLFRGGAGTGKSFTLREVKAGLIQAGHTVQILAPQRQQVADLERDGFSGAQTISALLNQRFLTRGTIVLVDEAGQVGGQQMLELLSMIQTVKGRVILSGDTHQHEAVEASDALRAIEQCSGLGYAELTNIRRQNPQAAKTKAERHWLEQYRLAVKEVQQGKLGASFDRLDKYGAIVLCTLADQQEKLTENFWNFSKINNQPWSSRKVGQRFTRSMNESGSA